MSRREQDGMIGLSGRVFNHTPNVFARKIMSSPARLRIVCENLVITCSGTKQFQNIRNADSQATNTGLAGHYIGSD
jgi:hypothetical protein